MTYNSSGRDDHYDGAFLFGEASVDPRGREYAEKLATLLTRFLRIGGGQSRAPRTFLPEPGYMLEGPSRRRTRDALLSSVYVFVIVTRELCACAPFVEHVDAEFGDIFRAWRAQQRLVPVYASFSSADHIPLALLPFGLDSVVGINVSDIATPRTLIDIDAHRIKAKHLQMMYVRRFGLLLDPSKRRPRRAPLTEAEAARRQAMYKFARKLLDEFSGGRAPSAGDHHGWADRRLQEAKGAKCGVIADQSHREVQGRK